MLWTDRVKIDTIDLEITHRNYMMCSVYVFSSFLEYDRRMLVCGVNASCQSYTHTQNTQAHICHSDETLEIDEREQNVNQLSNQFR